MPIGERLKQERVVYRLLDQLERDPDHVALAQALTLDAAKPLMGLRGRHGLFGSSEWWKSIEAGRIVTTRTTGVISRLWFAGQDSRQAPNTVDFIDDDGVLHSRGIYLTERSGRPLYALGRRIQYVEAHDELKAQPAADGSTDYARITIEVAISGKIEID
ncbi:hypothetical protein [Caulobacter mirabilis]|uniref:Uncharacterized protein n=1 Tax=Caulobacter mirabilis TaxID=69666 RepID=A0A2D2AWZ3_9CAUL|nr:hypothetical protein [Caulobacter mirabilis]ATQ42522.1 hypothetical protein CSW64_08900 [Caulobacter mirabilis]